MNETSPNGTTANGLHTSNGKFATGNPGGPGNPHGGQVARLRAAMLEAVSEDDMRAVVLKLVEMAKGGDLKAIDLLLNRTLGKADSGPLVAVQMNQQSNGPGESPRRAAAIVARIRAERLARGEAPVEPLSPDLEELRAGILKRIEAMRSRSCPSGEIAKVLPGPHFP